MKQAVDKEKDDEVTFAKLDLSKAGDVQSGTGKAPWKLSIDAPEEATAHTWSLNTSILVEKGNGFSLVIRDYKEDLAALKKAWMNDRFTKAILVEEADLLLREITSPLDKKKLVYEFVVNIKVGDKVYSCRSLPSGYRFSREDVDLMLKCARTLAAN